MGGFILSNIPVLILLTSTKTRLITFEKQREIETAISPSGEKILALTFDKNLTCILPKKSFPSCKENISPTNGLRCMGEIAPFTNGIIKCVQDESPWYKPKLFRSVLLVKESAFWRVAFFSFFSNISSMLGIFVTATLLFITAWLNKGKERSLVGSLIIYCVGEMIYALYLNTSLDGFVKYSSAISVSSVLRILYQTIIITYAFSSRKLRLSVVAVHALLLFEVFVTWTTPHTTSQFYYLILFRLFPIAVIFYGISLFQRSSSDKTIFKVLFHFWFWMMIGALLGYFSIHLSQLFTPAFLIVSSIYLMKVVINDLLKQKIERAFADAKLSQSEETNRSLLRMAHDLKSPISGIKLYIKEKQQGLNDELGEIFLTCFNRLQEIVTHSLDYARPSKLEEIEVGTVIKLLHSLKMEYQSRASIKIDSLHGLAGRKVIFLSTTEFTRMLSNLFHNSIEAQSKEPSIQVQIKNTEDFLLIQIQDNGPGFKEDALKEIRAGRKVTTKDTGTGIGLSSIKAMLQSSGGFFELKNHPDGGAMISIYLKLA